jgi:hypothetical protein
MDFVTISGPFQLGHELAVLMLVQRPLSILFFYKKKALAGRALVQEFCFHLGPCLD